MKHAPVTAIIPCYACVQTIERTLESVALQTHRPKEVLLIDDASPDDTLSLLYELQKKYGSDWIRILKLPSNSGPSTARNLGWEKATQPYLAFLDADDLWHPQKIEIQYEWMQKHPDVDITGHPYQYLKNTQEFPPLSPHWKIKTISKTALLLSNRFTTPSVMLKRNLLERFDSTKRHAEDYLLWLTLISRGHKGVYLNLPLVYLLKHAYGSGGLSQNLWKMEKGELSTYWRLHSQGNLSTLSTLLLSGYSLTKYLRRVVITSLKK